MVQDMAMTVVSLQMPIHVNPKHVLMAMPADTKNGHPQRTLFGGIRIPGNNFPPKISTIRSVPSTEQRCLAGRREIAVPSASPKVT